MQLELSNVKQWKGDVVVVEPLSGADKVGSIYIPANHRDQKEDSGCLWSAVVRAFGDAIDRKVYGWQNVAIGDTVWMRPFSRQCPNFVDKSGKRYVIARQEDVFCAEEAVA